MAVIYGAATLLLCFFYIMIGTTIILTNKYILYDLNFQYPIFLSFLGVTFSAIGAHGLVRFGYVKLQKKDEITNAFWYKKILPICFNFASSLALGNLAYLYLNVGFIQMFKSFTPVLIMLVSFLMSVEIPSQQVIISVIIISIGTAATCSYTPQLSLIGLSIMFAAEVLESIRLVLTQFVLQNLKFGVTESQYVLAPPSALWLLVTSMVFKFSSMYEKKAWLIVFENPLVFLCASSLGLAVNFLSYYVIQSTSGLTMKILGGVRNIATIVAGVIRYGELVDFREGAGYTVAFAGFIMYSMAKSGFWDNNNNKSKSGTAFVSSHGGVSAGSSAMSVELSAPYADIHASGSLSVHGTERDTEAAESLLILAGVNKKT